MFNKKKFSTKIFIIISIINLFFLGLIFIYLKAGDSNKVNPNNNDNYKFFLKENIDISTNEHKEREERLKALEEKLEHDTLEHEKLEKTHSVIEKSISDSKAIFQKLKTDLETQEKEIRDKESRIQRLEVLSLIYRASKFFGGI